MRKIANNRVLECFHCHKIIKGKKISNLRSHIKLHGPFVDRLKCLECPQTFQTKGNLKQHWSRKHAHLVEIKVMPTSRMATPFRTIIAPSYSQTNTPKMSNRKFTSSLTANPSFRENTVLISKSLDQRPNLRKSKRGRNKSPLVSDSIEIPYRNKTISLLSVDVPDILYAVGLCKVDYNPPKCYGKKIDLVREIPAPLYIISYDDDENFGKLDWEQNK